MKDWSENDSFIEASYTGDIPDERFYEQMGYPHSNVTPLFKPPNELEESDFYSKEVFESETVEGLISQIEGDGMLVFRYDGEDLSMGSKYKGVETEYSITESSREDLNFIEEVLEDYSGKNEFKWSTNADSYLSMDELRSGLSFPVGILPDIQGIESIRYNPNKDVELIHFGKDMIEVSDDFIDSQLDEYPGRHREVYRNGIEKQLRKGIDVESQGDQKINFHGKEITVEDPDWRLREYPVDIEAVESILDKLGSKGFETERLRLGPSQQPRDRSFLTTDFERI